MSGRIFLRTFIDALPRSDASIAVYHNDSTANANSRTQSISGTRPCNTRFYAGYILRKAHFVNTFLLSATNKL